MVCFVVKDKLIKVSNSSEDVALGGDREMNERKSLCSMVDRSDIKNAIVIADRGYENYNLMAHIQEKGWHYLIRIKERVLHL